MKKGFTVLFFFSTTVSWATRDVSFGGLKGPEKRWVFFHPFKALKAKRVTLLSRVITNGFAKDERYDQDPVGGQVDAFRHCFWTAYLSSQIGPKQAEKLGRLHEKANYIQFKKQELEDNIAPDSLSGVMDLHNNNVGVRLWKQLLSVEPILKKANRKELAILLKKEVIKKIDEGELLKLKKDVSGKFVDCDGKEINLALYSRKWYIPKCLVKSNK